MFLLIAACHHSRVYVAQGTFIMGEMILFCKMISLPFPKMFQRLIRRLKLCIEEVMKKLIFYMPADVIALDYVIIR